MEDRGEKMYVRMEPIFLYLFNSFSMIVVVMKVGPCLPFAERWAGAAGRTVAAREMSENKEDSGKGKMRMGRFVTPYLMPGGTVSKLECLPLRVFQDSYTEREVHTLGQQVASRPCPTQPPKS